MVQINPPLEPKNIEDLIEEMLVHKLKLRILQVRVNNLSEEIHNLKNKVRRFQALWESILKAYEHEDQHI